MRIKVQHGHRSIDLIQRAQRRQRDRMVPTERDDLRAMPILDLGGAAARRHLAVREVCVRLRHLAHREGIIERRHGHIAAVQNRRPLPVRVEVGARVVPPERGLAGRGGADGAGPEARAGPVGHGGVEGHAEDRDVEGGGLRELEAALVREVREGRDAAVAELDADGSLTVASS